MHELTEADIQNILHSDLTDPFTLLGKHPHSDGGCVIRTYQPQADKVSVVFAGKSKTVIPMDKIHDGGIFQVVIKKQPPTFYKLELTYGDRVSRIHDPYSFMPVMGEDDRYLFNQGNLHKVYQHLGAHLRTVDGVEGVHFAVWAPDAKRVSVVGDMNGWDGRKHMMRLLGSSGIWEIFIPGLSFGEMYKFEIKKHDRDHLTLKTDPFGYRHQAFPDHASVVTDIDSFEWTDDAWLNQRQEMGVRIDQPVNIYEVHPASWRRNPHEGNRRLNFRELAHDLGDYVKYMGYTHVELLPIAEHPLEASWGYQITGYFAVNHRLGTPQDFQYFVNCMHRLGIGVIIDWVPAHFPKDAHGLAQFDGTHQYEHGDPREGEHRDWGTLIFNFGRHEVRNFLVGNALFWLDKFHIDGLRVDAVASMLYRDYSREKGDWVANEYGGRENLEAVRFLQQTNAEVHSQYPGVLMIAEESTDWAGVTQPTYLGGLGFTYKWNMGWMHDTLEFFQTDPLYRKFQFNKITFGLWYAFKENWILCLSHDEVVHLKKSLLNKMPGDRWQQFANLRLLMGFMLGHPGKKLNFMGYEFGQSREWSHDRSLDWHQANEHLNRGLQTFVRDINQSYLQLSALWDQDAEGSGFAWVDCNDTENTVMSFLRFGYDWHNCLLFVYNFTPVPRPNYRIGVPHGGFWKEILNSDAAHYGGSGVGNWGGFQAEEVFWQDRNYSLNLNLPPLGVLVFQWQR